MFQAAAIPAAAAAAPIGKFPFMQQPQNPSSPKRFSDEQAREIYQRAAQIESKTLFGGDDESLSRDELENAANRAGISDRAVEAAIAQLERERVQAQQVAVQKSKTRRKIGIGAGVVGAILLLNGIFTQRALSSCLASVETARANEAVQVQRQRDLIPQITALANANLKNESALIAALNRPNVDAATLQRAAAELRDRGITAGASDEIAGTINRIGIARRDWNKSAGEYNRTASSFPSSAWRRVFGFPTKVEGYQGEAVRTAPRF